ncbi:MAG: hypothetical protein ACLT38_12745 [Akkermansia sp.]
MVIQDIPMVDQGQKGYCVVATAARIFAYYGMDYVDQHELASWPIPLRTEALIRRQWRKT